MTLEADTMADVDDDDYDVIVIGGGLTGLVAAYQILKKHANLSVMILEAEKSIGGVLNSLQDCEFYFKSNQEHIMKLMDELKINVKYNDCLDADDNCIMYFNNKPLESQTPFISSQVYHCLKLINETSMECQLESSLYDQELATFAEMSMAELISEMVVSSKAASICKSLISLACGFMSLEKVSALWLMGIFHEAGGLFSRMKFFLKSHSQCSIDGGIITLLEKIKEKISSENGMINYSEKVIEVNCNEYRALISTANKTYKCSYAIIALPPSCCREIHLNALSLKKYSKILNFYESESIIDFEAKYENNFWNAKSMSIITSSSKTGKTLRFIHSVTHPVDEQTNALSGYFSVNDAVTERDRIIELIETMNACFYTNLAHNYRHYREIKFAGGLMSVLQPCPIDCHLNIMQNPHERIFFAASEYARNVPGTADGAIEAGEHVACLVLHHVRPQTLNRSQHLLYTSMKLPKTTSNFRIFMARTVLLITNSMIFWAFLRSAYNL